MKEKNCCCVGILMALFFVVFEEDIELRDLFVSDLV